MAHRLAPAVESELDDIWYYIARESGSIEIADRLIDSITDRFFLLATHPYLDETGTRTFVLVCGAFPPANMSLFTVLKARTSLYCMWCGVAAILKRSSGAEVIHS
jgi:hypothetical protein